MRRTHSVARAAAFPRSYPLSFSRLFGTHHLSQACDKLRTGMRHITRGIGVVLPLLALGFAAPLRAEAPVLMAQEDANLSCLAALPTQDSLVLVSADGADDAAVRVWAGYSISACPCIEPTYTSEIIFLINVHDDYLRSIPDTTEWQSDVLSLYFNELSPAAMTAAGDECLEDGAITAGSWILDIPLDSDSSPALIRMRRYDEFLWWIDTTVCAISQARDCLDCEMETFKDGNETCIKVTFYFNNNLRGTSIAFSAAYNDVDDEGSTQERLTWLDNTPDEPSATLAQYWGEVVLDASLQAANHREMSASPLRVIPSTPVSSFSLLGQRLPQSLPATRSTMITIRQSRNGMGVVDIVR